MTTFNDSESGASVRTKINAAITTVDGLGSGDNLLLTAAERSKLTAIEALADVTDATNVAAAGAVMDGDFSTNGVMTRTGAGTYAVKTVTGADAAVVTGTAGTTDQIAVWNADGDIVGATAGTIAGLTEKVTPASGDFLVLSDTAASGALKKIDWDSLPGATGVDTSGTPVANDFARFTDADTIEGRSYAEVRADLGLEIGTDVQAYDANLPTWPATVDATEVGYLNGVTSAIQTQIDTKAATTLSVNAQTGTTYTLVLGDAGKKVTMANASANTLTIPTNASVAFPTGTIIGVSMLGAGATTVDGDTGVTVNGVSAGGAAISAQYTGVTLTKIGTDTWLMEGNHGTVA